MKYNLYEPTWCCEFMRQMTEECQNESTRTTQNVGIIIKLVLFFLFVIDAGYLFYEHRLKTYVFSYVSTKLAAPSIYDDWNTCEEENWWFDFNGKGSNPWQKILKEEKEFPLAYTIIAFERPDQVWRILRSIYRPQNYYCIHFDKKSPDIYKKWLIRKITKCIPKEVAKNIIFIPSIAVYHSYFSVLEADLACMRRLWKVPNNSTVPPWKYLINLTGQEFPLKNNLELTRILRVLNNANLIQQEK
ncbi:unnamed protein product [Hymenolepis diminuta]|uniref:Core-2/I-Branching enzyme n=1 Tax=Hymenolepis diminuta TaxID=6216 RepID=A0A0R3SK48_HYMDI|nr:unnamed protein product [Hymenolepis diminuta]